MRRRVVGLVETMVHSSRRRPRRPLFWHLPGEAIIRSNPGKASRLLPFTILFLAVLALIVLPAALTASQASAEPAAISEAKQEVEALRAQVAKTNSQLEMAAEDYQYATGATGRDGRRPQGDGGASRPYAEGSQEGRRAAGPDGWIPSTGTAAPACWRRCSAHALSLTSSIASTCSRVWGSRTVWCSIR